MSGFDIVSTVATAEQFAKVVFKTIKLVKSVIDQILDVPDQIQQQVGRLESLDFLAKQIKSTKILQTDEINGILTRCENRVQSLHDILKKTSFDSHDSIGKKTWRAIFSLKEENNILKLFDMLDQEYNLLDTHINLRVLAVVENIQVGHHSIDFKLNAIAQAADPSPDSLKCLQALFITDPAIDRAKLITSKGELVQGTCDWITERKEFVDWRASDGGLLWISGGPGLGKTMLSIYLTEYLPSCFRSPGNTQSYYSTYFFCDAKETRRNNAVAIIRGILFQLLEQKEGLIKHILPTYIVQKEQIFQQSSFEMVWKFFMDMMNDLGESQATCILDGLDECEPMSLEPLLTKLKSITDTLPQLKLIVLSREFPQCIGDSLSRFQRLRLDPDAKTEVSDGLDQYISTRVAELSESKQYPAELTEHIKEILREKSSGTYLWISFVVKDLQTIETSEVEESLNQLPRGLDALYERILQQIEGSRQDRTLEILRWCTFATRPLSLDELATALKIEPTKLLDKVTVLRGNLTYCGHFLTIANDSVTLVHQSAYDFLTRRSSSLGLIPWFSLSNVEVEQSKLASTCVAYFYDICLNDKDIAQDADTEEKRLQYPFLKYAGSQWVDHVNGSGQEGVNILDEYSEFFCKPSKMWKLWGDLRFHARYGYLEDPDQLERIATHLGLTILVQRILEKEGTWIYLKEIFSKRRRTLLHTAIAGGHSHIAKMLIENKMHINKKNLLDETPLHYAVQGGHLATVEMLLQKKAHINAKGFQKESPLHYAAKMGHLAIVEILVKKGAHIDSTNHQKETPLSIAVREGHFKTAKYLLDCGALVDGADGGPSPLSWAISSAKPEFVKLLLERGADDHIPSCMIVGSVGWILSSSPETLITFLEIWAQRLSTSSSQFRDKITFGETTALHLACKKGILPAIHLLIDPKWNLDLNWRDGIFENTPLHVAAIYGNIEAVDLLLAQSSVDPKPINKWGLNPMHMACLNHQTTIVDRLIKEYKISVPEFDESCRLGAIHLAVLNHGRKQERKQPNEMLEFLIKGLGADPQLRTPKSNNPNHKWHMNHASRSGMTGLIRPPDFCDETPLSLAIRQDCKSSIQYFLDQCNIDPNAPCRGCDGASPLHVAVQNLHSDIVEMLISKWKANVNCLDNYKRTPLHLVGGRILSMDRFKQKLFINEANKIIQILLTAGAQISTIDINGRSCRDVFASRKFFKEARLLMGMERVSHKHIRFADDLYQHFLRPNIPPPP
ncbi:ankyrin repeat-containing domain protein [Trichoderma chlorosporum]